ILGQSGCGKTTLLRYLAGIINEQVVWNGDLSISNLIPLQGQGAYMAQQDLLMPWLPVLENVLLSDKFSQRSRQINKQQKHQQVEKATYLLQPVGLADKAQQRPQNL
ncbi:ATP-binding cassette domain-containing protein, partial [Psychromonas aquatilis]